MLTNLLPFLATHLTWHSCHYITLTKSKLSHLRQADKPDHLQLGIPAMCRTRFETETLARASASVARQAQTTTTTTTTTTTMRDTITTLTTLETSVT